ncbi:MAG: hypothetical protein NT002_11490 [candidate division Zixibacteria bacterium]|nr:hypothetical protein [candidate division Zixibacteria bacterium]
MLRIFHSGRKIKGSFFYRFVPLFIGAITFVSPSVMAQAKVGTVPFLPFSTSPRANGMGSCTVNLADEESSQFNPGASGIFFLNHYFGVTLPVKTKIFPDFVVDEEVGVKTFHLGIGTPFLLHRSERWGDLEVAPFVAYHQVNLDYGRRHYVDYPHSFWREDEDKYSGYSFGLGASCRYLKIGIGYTFKTTEWKISIEDTAQTNMKWHARDFGLLVEIPLLRDEAEGGNLKSGRKYSFELTPSFAFVIASKPADENEAIENSLPKMRRIGLSTFFAVKDKTANVITIRPAFEFDKSLVNSEELTTRIGAEFGVADILYLRVGKQKLNGKSENSGTFGIGVSTRGLMALIYPQDKRDETLISRILGNLDLQFDYARANGLNTLTNTNYMKISLSFR